MTLQQPRSTLFPYTTLFRSFLRPKRFQIIGLGVPDDLHALAGEVPRETRQHQPGPVDGRLADDALQPAGASHQAHLQRAGLDRKSTRLNSSHTVISYAVFCL